jgi:hypothetical protein
MKFSEVKPFLMAGFKIDRTPFDGNYWVLRNGDLYQYQKENNHIKKEEKCRFWNIDNLETGIFGIMLGKHEWKVLDADPEKLTREQAIKLMDAGYKVCRLEQSTGCYVKVDGIIKYYCTISKKLDIGSAILFDVIDAYKLYDNEPVKQELTTGKIIAMGYEASNAIERQYDEKQSSYYRYLHGSLASQFNKPIKLDVSEAYRNTLKKRVYNEKPSSYYRFLYGGLPELFAISGADIRPHVLDTDEIVSHYIIDDPLYLKQEKPMNKSFVKIIAMGCDRSERESKNVFYSHLWHSSFMNNQLNFYIVDDITKEKPMNKSFEKIKPFVLAGFKFSAKNIINSWWFYHNNKMAYANDFYIVDGSPISTFEKSNDEYYLLPNQNHHAKNLSYEQAKVLCDAGYTVRINPTNKYGVIKYISCTYDKRHQLTSDGIYELIDNLPTTETNEVTTFDFAEALGHFNNGKKLTHEELSNYSVYLIKDSIGNIVDKDGDIYNLSSDEIFKAKWSLYEEKPKYEKDDFKLLNYKYSGDLVLDNVKSSYYWGFIDIKKKTLTINKTAIEADGYTVILK